MLFVVPWCNIMRDAPTKDRCWNIRPCAIIRAEFKHDIRITLHVITLIELLTLRGPLCNTSTRFRVRDFEKRVYDRIARSLVIAVFNVVPLDEDTPIWIVLDPLLVSQVSDSVVPVNGILTEYPLFGLREDTQRLNRVIAKLVFVYRCYHGAF